MKFFTKRKDGGDESTVTGYWLIEWKGLFSICLLKFEGKSREAFHTHAFNCFSWVVKGKLFEEFLNGEKREHPASFMPFITRRTDFHKVSSNGTSWVLSFRGPWKKYWKEFRPFVSTIVTLKDGRQVVDQVIHDRDFL